jgi:limonene-1,2-epoxide hydrolase
MSDSAESVVRRFMATWPRFDVFDMMGKTFDVEISGVFEVNDDGRISRWRDYYDMRSLEERVAAAMAAEGK